MKRIIPMILLVFLFALPVSAMEFTAPKVPESAEEYMPEDTTSFSEAIIQMLKNVIVRIRPDLKEAAYISCNVITMVLLISILSPFGGGVKAAGELVGAVGVSALLFRSTGSMIVLARDTVMELSSYGKMLLPVMTGALAAQGRITSSTGLYIGTALFDTVLGSLLSSVFVPFISVFLALAVAAAACAEDMLKRLCDMIKGSISWCLKTLLTIFTTYMSITGVISGTTDAATLKATKVTISTFVPMVGGILSDASEAVLVSAGVMKNAAGIYGIFAILALFLDPFLRIGAHYLLLKISWMICGVFGMKRTHDLVGDFSAAMGMLLALTGSMCLLLLISTVCFMRGAGL